MPTIKRFLVQGFALNVNDSAYLVEVSPHSEGMEQFQDLEKLPAWIFQSKHAIWLVPINAALADRAMKGEQIKRKLIPFFKQRIKPQN
ncbi:hypothetical protein L0244_08365 [bacterium]|nr:hypothetical protein [bacterium]